MQKDADSQFTAGPTTVGGRDIGPSAFRTINPAQRTAPRPRRIRPTFLIGFALALLVLGLALAAAPRPSASGLPTHLPSGATTSATPASTVCNAVSPLTPSALLIPITNPSHNLTAGGTISATAQIQIVNYSATQNGTQIYFPGLFYKFPLATGGNYTMFLAPHVLSISQGGWISSPFLNRSAVVPGGLAFKQFASATLSTQKLALMGTAQYGFLTVEVRWQWGNTVNGTSGMKHTLGPWSVPTAKSGYPKSLPSIFYPAPYVPVLSTSGGSPVIGDNYSATLGGLVAGHLYFLEMEYPDGKVVQDLGQTAPANATNFTVVIPVINYDHYLTPGAYLVHIHDACGAMLYNKTVKAVFAAHANFTFYFSPGTCGPITFNGTKYTNNTGASVVPSTTPYAFSIAVCKGYTFKGWQTTGGFHISSAGNMLVSASGTFTVYYK